MELSRRYSYTPRWPVIAACVAFFGSCAAFMAHEAITNTVGLTIDGVISLGPTGANVFYWMISGLGGGFVLMGVFLAIGRIVHPAALELSSTELLIPCGWFMKKHSRVVLAEIDRVAEVEASGQRFLYVFSAGMKHTITASLLPTKSCYAEVKEILSSQVEQNLKGIKA